MKPKKKKKLRTDRDEEPIVSPVELVQRQATTTRRAEAYLMGSPLRYITGCTSAMTASFLEVVQQLLQEINAHEIATVGEAKARLKELAQLKVSAAA